MLQKVQELYGDVEGPLPIQFFFRRKSDDKGKIIPALGKVCKQGDDIVSDIWCPDDAGGLDLTGYSSPFSSAAS